MVRKLGILGYEFLLNGFTCMLNMWQVFFVVCVILKYQEILTDPSYAGQFVLMTNPHIGNTGINFG